MRAVTLKSKCKRVMIGISYLESRISDPGSVRGMMGIWDF